MRAVVITSPGGPDVLRLTEVPDPEPAGGEVLIRVTAAGVNPADLLQRQGRYPPPPGAPPYPGLECAGTVAATGPGVSGWRPGDEVCALLGGGGYAELVAVPAGQVLPRPAGVSLRDAAALPEVTCTAHDALFHRARLAAGETVLVHGGAGGVGTMAIQLAKTAGATVICTAGQSRLAACRDLGADLAVPYTGDFTAAVAEFTGGSGADVILDIIGGPNLRPNLAALAAGGRLAVISLQGGGHLAELDLALLLGKRATLVGTTLRARPLPEKAAIVGRVREAVWPLVAAGRVRPVIHQVLPLAEAAAAHQLLAAGGHFGKVLLVT